MRAAPHLFRGVRSAGAVILASSAEGAVPAEESFHFPCPPTFKALLEGASSWSTTRSRGEAAQSRTAASNGRCWPIDEEPYAGWYCNTILPRPGDPRAGGLKRVVKALRTHAERIGFRRAAAITTEDATGGDVSCSLFLRQPQFQGQPAIGWSRRGDPAGRGCYPRQA
jgi:hypothetical protein